MFHNKITFSIIVPVYNVEKYLPKCLDSLVNQTYTNIEIICVNDGSTDSSFQVLEEYAQLDSRIRVINQENQGVSVARNVGIENSTGEYILFVDADDWLNIKTCEKINANLLDNDLISFNATFVSKNKLVLGIKKNKSTMLNCGMWAICYKREFLNKNQIRFPQGIKIAEDSVFKCQAFSQTNNILILDNYLYFYLADRENSASKVENIIQDDIETFYYMIRQSWFNNISIAKQSYIIDFWIKSIGGTLFNNFIDINQVNIDILASYIKKVEQISSRNNYKLKNLKNLKIFVILIKLHLFWIYKDIIRQLGKHLIVLPYRKILYLLKGGK